MSQLSGKFVLRVSPLFHKQLKEEAQSQKLSLNDWIVKKLMSSNGVQSSEVVLKTIQNCFDGKMIGIVQFGSTVRGDQKTNSDIDLLIVLKNNQEITRSLYTVWDEKVAPTLGNKYSPQFSHLTELERVSSLWLEIAMEGIVLLDENNLIKNHIIEIRRKIAAGKYLRKLAHGHPYWVANGEQSAK